MKEEKKLIEKLKKLDGDSEIFYNFTINSTQFEVKITKRRGLYVISLMSINGKPFLKDCFYSDLSLNDVIRILTKEKEEYFDP